MATSHTATKATPYMRSSLIIFDLSGAEIHGVAYALAETVGCQRVQRSQWCQLIVAVRTWRGAPCLENSFPEDALAIADGKVVRQTLVSRYAINCVRHLSGVACRRSAPV